MEPEIATRMIVLFFYTKENLLFAFVLCAYCLAVPMLKFIRSEKILLSKYGFLLFMKG